MRVVTLIKYVKKGNRLDVGNLKKLFVLAVLKLKPKDS